MTLRRLLPLLALSLSACTYDTDTKDADFHPPVLRQHWQSDHYALQNGSVGCTISSGSNGITVAMLRKSDGDHVSVYSNRRMEPGATLTATIGSDTYNAYGTYFPANVSAQLTERLAKGGTAYFEWAEFSGPSGRERVRVQNVVPLDDFAARLADCRKAIK